MARRTVTLSLPADTRAVELDGRPVEPVRRGEATLLDVDLSNPVEALLVR